MTETRFHKFVDGSKRERWIAYRHTPGAGPTLVFLPGYMSDMAGSKATALFAEATGKGRGCLLFDYSGCGESPGDFADGTFTRWREEVLSLIDAYVDGPVLLVGSSMGGWLMLLIGEELGGRLAGMIGIAAAPDFTRWGYSPAQRKTLRSGKSIYENNPYGPEPTPTHSRFFTDAERQLRLNTEISMTCPVRLIHGQRDADVPWETSLRLARALRSDDVQVTLVKDGDHRLSRPGDIALLNARVDSFY